MADNRHLSYFHRGGDTPLIGATIGDFIRNVARRVPEQDAVVSIPQELRLSYQDLDREVDRLARGLLALGVARADRVGIWSTDNVEWILLQLATARVGAVLVNINPAYRAYELQHALRLAKVNHIFLIPSFRSSRYVEMICAVCPEVTTSDPDQLRSKGLPDMRHAVVFDPADIASMTRPERGFLTWAEVLERGRDVDDHACEERAESLDPDDAINIQFTSGTTGFPKAVVLTHHNILNNAFFVGEAMRLTTADRLCVPLPFYHCFGMVVSTLACLTHGAAVVIPAPHFEAGATLAAIERERCTALHGVPTMFTAEFECENFSRYDLSSLRTGIIAGAPCPPDLLRRIMNEMGCKEILIAYGQTESSPVTHITHPEDSLERRTETVGTNLPHQEVKVVDPATGAMAPLGVPGEICFRGYHVMRGYFGEEEANPTRTAEPDGTRSSIDQDGWLHSGDLGVMEEEGYVRITGRLKDMIIRGGENIYPAEIEAFFFAHPKVAEVAVFGVPDARMGEAVAAWVRPHAGMSIDPDELKDYAKSRIAYFKVPQHIWIVDEFPLTASGKIQKFRMREIAVRRLEEESDSRENSPATA